MIDFLFFPEIDDVLWLDSSFDFRFRLILRPDIISNLVQEMIQAHGTIMFHWLKT